MGNNTDIVSVVSALLFLGLLALLYLLPTVIAWNRGHHNKGAILAVNILLGWTFLGWVAAFVWACTAVNPALMRR